MPQGRGGTKKRKKRRRRQRDSSDPFTVHAPQQPEEVATGSYIAACNGQRVPTPPNLVVRYDERGAYLVAGPHERYYRWCSGCAPAE